MWEIFFKFFGVLQEKIWRRRIWRSARRMPRSLRRSESRRCASFVTGYCEGRSFRATSAPLAVRLCTRSASRSLRTVGSRMFGLESVCGLLLVNITVTFIFSIKDPMFNVQLFDWLFHWLIFLLKFFVIFDQFWLMDWLIDCGSDWLIDWLIAHVSYCLIDWLIPLLVVGSIFWSIDWLIDEAFEIQILYRFFSFQLPFQQPQLQDLPVPHPWPPSPVPRPSGPASTLGEWKNRPPTSRKSPPSPHRLDRSAPTKKTNWHFYFPPPRATASPPPSVPIPHRPSIPFPPRRMAISPTPPRRKNNWPSSRGSPDKWTGSKQRNFCSVSITAHSWCGWAAERANQSPTRPSASSKTFLYFFLQNLFLFKKILF